MTDLAAGLRDTLLELVRIPSPTGEEAALADHVCARLGRSLGAARVRREGESVLVHALSRVSAPRIALVGHLDTVRTEHDGPPRIEGDRLYGAGASDMKSGLAVMIELAERLRPDACAADVTLVFYDREEGPFEENGLGPLLERHAELRTLDLAIALEPSDAKLQLGCMGSLHATVRFLGRTAHSARPWQGENAILRSAPLLARLGALPPEDVEVDGLCYREVVTPTLARGGRSRNIVPDAFELNLNYRFAPHRTVAEAEARLRALVADAAEVEPVDRAPAGRPHRHHPLVERLVRSGVRAVEPKQAWTDVARFDAAGVTAVNFGPGVQAQAHQRSEYTSVPQLAEGYEILARFLASAAG